MNAGSETDFQRSQNPIETQNRVSASNFGFDSFVFVYDFDIRVSNFQNKISSNIFRASDGSSGSRVF